MRSLIIVLALVSMAFAQTLVLSEQPQEVAVDELRTDLASVQESEPINDESSIREKRGLLLAKVGLG